MWLFRRWRSKTWQIQLANRNDDVRDFCDFRSFIVIKIALKLLRDCLKHEHIIHVQFIEQKRLSNIQKNRWKMMAYRMLTNRMCLIIK